MTITIVNEGRYAQNLLLIDHLPQQLGASKMPIACRLEADSRQRLDYEVTAYERGDMKFESLEVVIPSRWGWWEFSCRFIEPQTVRVFPHFAHIAKIAAIGVENHAQQLGIHLRQRRGEGTEFHQLREFRLGDSLRQIDWKASSRHAKPISREYQNERDQDIVFVLDCGRRMRAKDGPLSHFDHALNAILVTAYVALSQGDAVGLGTFAGRSRWVPPAKGDSHIHSLMQQVYDLHSSTEGSDLLAAANDVMVRHRKRSLVVLVSTLREEDKADTLQAVRLLQRRHAVLVANLREAFVDETLAQAPSDLSSALFYGATYNFDAQFTTLSRWLKAQGVFCVDSVPAQLYVALVEQYLALKRSGHI